MQVQSLVFNVGFAYLGTRVLENHNTAVIGFTILGSLLLRRWEKDHGGRGHLAVEVCHERSEVDV
jgi:hypothetical protein